MNEPVKCAAAAPTEDAYAEIHETLDAVEKYLLEQDCGGGSGKSEDPAPQAGFGRRVRALRERLGLSQADFARRYGLDLGTLRGWEQGRRNPDRANRTLIGAIEADPRAMASLISKSMFSENDSLGCE
jgi:putative transcriptional regulator